MNCSRSVLLFALLFALPSLAAPQARAELLAGAAVVDVTPDQLPVLVNGGMTSRTADAVKTRVNARAIVLSSTKPNSGDDERIAIVVVDSCMVPKLLLDDAKQRAAARTKLRPDRILVSATHTHTAPSSFGALGTDADPAYVPFLREKIAEAVVAAEQNLRPARVGWASGAAAEFTALRRWVRRPDRLDNDPFGNPTVRANMHAAGNPDDVTGESGPEDPELSIIAFESTDGVPIAALANFSMHYFGDQPISADYFGLFCDGLEQHAKAKHPKSEMVGIMSHGCSGDIWRRDYMTYNAQQKDATIEGYTEGLLEIAAKIYDSVEYTDDADLAMAEARLPMKYRVPNKQLLQWSQQIVDGMPEQNPQDRTEVYAREQVLLDQMQTTEIVVQAIRIGDIGIATTPTETYALTGLKLKHHSPLRHTMVIELANGADGYIPPPEQHHLGGYNTWAARSAGLETAAEPRIVAASLGLLEQVSGYPRRDYSASVGPAAKAILADKPVAYWRFSEMEAPAAVDASPAHRDGVYEPGVCFFLEGPQELGYTISSDVNRCAHFAGGRMRARLESLGDQYTVIMSFWNGMPNDARATAGWLFSRDHPHALSSDGEHLGVGGTATEPGRLIFQQGFGKPSVGKTTIERWTWNELRMVREPGRVRVYLNGSDEPEIDAEVRLKVNNSIATCFLGGRSDNDSNWEGRIDEVAVFDRAVEAVAARLSEISLSPTLLAAESDRPNIIYIMTDDLGYGDLGCYGQKVVETPNLDRMAAEGMRFTDHYAGHTVCRPSRLVLWTGQHVGHTGLTGNRPRNLTGMEATVAQQLKAAGYATGGVGKWALGNVDVPSEIDNQGHPNNNGFDYWFGYLNQSNAHNFYPTFLWENSTQIPLPGNVIGDYPNGRGRVSSKKVTYSHDLMTDAALKFVRDHKDEPFLLHVHWTIPHANNEGGRVSGDGMEVPDYAQYAQQDWPTPEKGFAAMVSRMDGDVGRLMKLLKELGLDEKTLVLFTSDNGPHQEGGHDHEYFDSNGPLKGYKRSMHDGGIRVPMIARWPGKIQSGSVTDLPSAFWDFLPTACELAKVEISETRDGISYLPTLLGKSDQQKKHEYLYWASQEGDTAVGVRMGKWKLVQYRAKKQRGAAGDPAENRSDDWRLYDLTSDIGEDNDVAKQHPNIVTRMLGLLERDGLR